MREVKGKPHTLYNEQKEWSALLVVLQGGKTGGYKTGSLQTTIRLVSRDEVPRMGATSVGVCRGSACHRPVSFQPDGLVPTDITEWPM